MLCPEVSSGHDLDLQHRLLYWYIETLPRMVLTKNPAFLYTTLFNAQLLSLHRILILENVKQRSCFNAICERVEFNVTTHTP